MPAMSSGAGQTVFKLFKPVRAQTATILADIWLCIRYNYEQNQKADTPALQMAFTGRVQPRSGNFEKTNKSIKVLSTYYQQANCRLRLFHRPAANVVAAVCKSNTSCASPSHACNAQTRRRQPFRKRNVNETGATDDGLADGRLGLSRRGCRDDSE
eukprot:6186931-Pleurochrysis_carterae.AAC.2